MAIATKILLVYIILTIGLLMMIINYIIMFVYNDYIHNAFNIRKFISKKGTIRFVVYDDDIIIIKPFIPFFLFKKYKSITLNMSDKGKMISSPEKINKVLHDRIVKYHDKYWLDNNAGSIFKNGNDKIYHEADEIYIKRKEKVKILNKKI